MKKQSIAAAVCMAVAATMQARAADEVPQIQSQVQAPAQAQAELEVVQITGTRIQHVGMTTPTPVTSVTLDELNSMQPTTMINALVQLPQFYGSATTSNFNTGGNGFFVSPGGGSLNLRGMGTKRTLTLLDGRRMVDSSLYGGPDINLFPQTMAGLKTQIAHKCCLPFPSLIPDWLLSLIGRSMRTPGRLYSFLGQKQSGTETS